MPDVSRLANDAAAFRWSRADLHADASELLHGLTEAAAHAAGCGAAMLLLGGPATGYPWQVAQGFGLEGSGLARDAIDRVAAASLLAWLEGGPAAQASPIEGAAGIRLLASAPVHRHRSPCGLLAVFSMAPHPGLTAAQSTVLRTHAALCSLLLEWQDAKGKQQGAPSDAATERLRLLESVVVHANDAVLITEVDILNEPGPRILYCNAAFTRMTGYREEEVLGRTPRLLQGSDTDRAALDRLRGNLAAWKPSLLELVNYHKDGSAFRVELSIVPVAGPSGRFTHWVSVQRNISDRVAAEKIATRARIAEVEKQALETEIHGRKLVEAQLYQAAFHDELTALPNRAFFMQRLLAALGAVRGASDVRAALLFLDLNRFKSVNDRLGHVTGDQLLVEVARRLGHCVRGSDLVARMGGDEFALLVDLADGPQAAPGVAQRIVEALAVPFRLGGHEVRCSCSIGIVQLTPDYRDPAELLRDADIAMYRAKRTETGIGTYAVFTNVTDAAAVLRLELQLDLEGAAGRGEFQLEYQPIFSARSGEVSAFEALVRWKHPRRGWLGPGLFIPVAEEAGLVSAIGRWVFGQAMRQARAWRALYPTHGFKMNVNLSARELLDEAFLPRLLDLLAQTGLDPGMLVLEITETVFLDRSPVVLHVLERLRAMGVRLALDDFGTGYSSLGYLDSYPIDTLKIDRSFVAGLLEHRRPRTIVQAVLRLAEALDLDTVAEGVETEAQRGALLAMGCGHLQGFHLARPLGVQAAEAWLRGAPKPVVSPPDLLRPTAF